MLDDHLSVTSVFSVLFRKSFVLEPISCWCCFLNISPFFLFRLTITQLLRIKYDPQIVSVNSNERLNFLPTPSQPHPFSRLGGEPVLFPLYSCFMDVYHILWEFNCRNLCSYTNKYCYTLKTSLSLLIHK